LLSACDNAGGGAQHISLGSTIKPAEEIVASNDEAVASSKDIGLSLSIDKIGDADLSILLKFILVNNSSEKMVFLPWGTPFESVITADFLTITDIESGEQLVYQGIVAKRMPPKSADYLSVAPGESIENSLDVSKSYTFCADRRYTIEFSGALYNAEYRPFDIQSNSTELSLSKNFKPC